MNSCVIREDLLSGGIAPSSKSTSTQSVRSSAVHSIASDISAPRETRVADYAEELENKFQSFLLRVAPLPRSTHLDDTSDQSDKDSITSIFTKEKMENVERDRASSNGEKFTENSLQIDLNGCEGDVESDADYRDTFANLMEEATEHTPTNRQSPFSPLHRQVASPTEYRQQNHYFLKDTKQEENSLCDDQLLSMEKQREYLVTENARLQCELEKAKEANVNLIGQVETLRGELCSVREQAIEMQQAFVEKQLAATRERDLELKDQSRRDHECLQEQIQQLNQTMAEFKEEKEALFKQIGTYEERIENLVRELESKEFTGLPCSAFHRPLPKTIPEASGPNEMSNIFKQQLLRAFSHAESLQHDLEASKRNLQLVEDNLKYKLLQQEKKMEETFRERQTQWLEKTKASQNENLQKLRDAEKRSVDLENLLIERNKQVEEQLKNYNELQNAFKRLQQRVLREVRQECQHMKAALDMDVMSKQNEDDNGMECNPSEIWITLASLRAHSRELCKLVEDLNKENEQLREEVRIPVPGMFHKISDDANEAQRQWMSEWKETTKNMYAKKIKVLHAKHQQVTKQLVETHQRELSEMESRMHQWKESMIERMASRFQKEFQEVLESRVSRITAARQQGEKRGESKSQKCAVRKTGGTEFSPNMDVLHELKVVIQQLREENVALRQMLLAKQCADADKTPMAISEKGGLSLSRPENTIRSTASSASESVVKK